MAYSRVTEARRTMNAGKMTLEEFQRVEEEEKKIRMSVGARGLPPGMFQPKGAMGILGGRGGGYRRR